MIPHGVGLIRHSLELRQFTKCGCHGFVGHMSKVFDTPLRGQFVLESRLARNKSDGANEAFTAFALYLREILYLYLKRKNGRDSGASAVDYDENYKKESLAPLLFVTVEAVEGSEGAEEAVLFVVDTGGEI